MIRAWLERRYRPDGNVDSALSLPYGKLHEAGYRLILMDIDNTLAVHGQKSPGPQAMAVLSAIQQADLQCIVLSNAMSARLDQFCRALGVDYIPHARKPSVRGVYKACKLAGVRPAQTVLVGDQLFTDIAAANRAGCLSIRVTPLSSREPFPIMLKRVIENLVRRWIDLKEGYLNMPAVLEPAHKD